MPYKCPLGKLPEKRKYKPYNGDIIPESINLPDGRSIAVADITNKIKNRKSHSRLPKPKRLATATGYRPSVVTRFTKYTPEERQWQAEQKIETIAERYGINATQARAIRSQARQIVELLNSLDKSHVDTANGPV
jgi:hypothetical protein